MTITINGTTGIAGVDGSAATPSVQGADTNTGMFFPAADQVALSAGGSQVVLVNASGSTITGTQSVSGNLLFNSGYGSAATAYGCRAWVNFNGTGTVAIRNSGNVTSITDNSAGNYTVNFTTAMPDINYSISAMAGSGNTAGNLFVSNYGGAGVTTTTVRIVNWISHTAVQTDADTMTVSIFR